jgi:hypothetical protein
VCTIVSCTDIRLMQSEPWAKYGAASIRDAQFNQDQRMHCDFGNNTMAVPPAFDQPEVVAAILYYRFVKETYYRMGTSSLRCVR